MRIEKSKLLLRTTGMLVSEISDAVGYDDQSYFTRLFRKYTGVSPLQYRNQKKQEE